MKLVLGVWDVPYSGRSIGAKGQALKGIKYKARRSSAGFFMTTGEVANIIEAKYGLMNVFVNDHKPAIAQEIMEELMGRLQAPQPGQELSLDRIAHWFKDDLSQMKFNGRIPGVPTLASKKGISHRFKSKKRKGKTGETGPRPSFIDTGMFQNSMRVVLRD